MLSLGKTAEHASGSQFHDAFRLRVGRTDSRIHPGVVPSAPARIRSLLPVSRRRHTVGHFLPSLWSKKSRQALQICRRVAGARVFIPGDNSFSRHFVVLTHGRAEIATVIRTTRIEPQHRIRGSSAVRRSRLRGVLLITLPTKGPSTSASACDSSIRN
jgi:hypothetical protein